MSETHPALPAEIEQAMRRAKRLSWISIGLLTSIIVAMALVMGGSQAMRTAWVEDMLSLLPPIAFLIALRLEEKPATNQFPFGFYRANSLAFLIAATALTAMGALMLYEAGATLIKREHPTIGSYNLFGHEIWMGWIMIAVLIYSVIPPMILGRLKKPVAAKIADKVLHTDALMNAADWQTGLAGIFGIVGVAFGLWWADAAAAGFISFSILTDGLKSMRSSIFELIDGAPRKIDGPEIDPLVDRLVERLKDVHGDVNIQVRETGRFMRAVVEPPDRPHVSGERARSLIGDDEAWRLIEVALEQREDRPERAKG
ncbi:cation diffusion facilitator family transporter [Microvirga lenta]|uniref:cation diffusion facilitator family transporter n=1 Tax=Microvirga lenta TaxID=2881337 RepID=UPI001CFFCC95|nr:cation diffusion facilitator family transporter [Microvirga lenta]MCB5176405.1 cation diffusion facilitator family transporter [Microvirga lenta]